MLDLLAGGRFKKQLDGFLQIQAGFLDSLPLTGYIYLRAESHIGIILAFNNCCKLLRIVHVRFPPAESSYDKSSKNATSVTERASFIVYIS